MPKLLPWLLILLVGAVTRAEAPASFTQPDARAFPDLFVWADTSNVYVLRDGDGALLIDLGDGSVLDRLGDIGVKRVDWVLFTHHHREQCQGAPRLQGTATKVAAPEGEQGLFERPTNYRRMKVRLNDPFTIHGTSYVRPAIRPILLDKPLKPGESFKWGKYEIACLATPGNSPAAMTYVVELDGRKLAFSGDVMLDGATMHTWYDTEWDYGFAAGIRALRKTVATLTDAKHDVMMPSHGPVIRDPAVQLQQYAQKLERLEKLYVRGYGAEAASNAYQDKVSKPTPIKDLAQISPRLFKFKRTNFWPNFNLILADSGRALLVDCGLLNPDFLDETLEGMKKLYGLKAIDAIVVSHMHGDHFLQAPHIRQKWGAKIWALDNMVQKMEHPERFDYPAPIQAYGSGFDRVKVDRAFKPGESFKWEGYKFTIDWMPGQTEFALCMHGVIDGQKVVFTGDNIFGDPDDPTQTGHEAMVARNSAILEEGYIHGAELLAHIKPDVIVGGHSFVMGNPAAFIERYRKWSYEMRDAFQSLSPDPDYRYGFDPYWVRAYPYRTPLLAGGTGEVTIHVRNFRKAKQAHRIEFHAPPGVSVEPAVLQGELAAESRGAFPVRVTAAAAAGHGTHVVAMDVTLDGKRYGERFDFIVGVDAREARRPRDGELGVALAQPLVVLGDVARNVANMEPLVADAARRGARLVVFSECGITGYDLKGVGAEAAIPLDDPALDRVSRMAREHRLAIVAGLHEKSGGKKLHNTAVAFLPDGKRVVQRKHLVMPAEKAICPVEPGERKRVTFEVDGFRCAMLICSDAGIVGIYDELATERCDAVILLAAGAGNESFGLRQAELAKPEVLDWYSKTALTYVSPEGVKQSLRLNIAQVAVNQAGHDPATGYFHPGGSSLIDRTGEVTAVIPPRLVFEHLRPGLSVGWISGERGPH